MHTSKNFFRVAIIASLISLVIILPTFNVAASNEKPFEGVKLNVLFSAAHAQVLSRKARVDSFEERTGIEVNYIGTPYANLKNKITSDAVMGGGKFDVVTFAYTLLPSMSKYLTPLNEFIEEDNFDIGQFPEAFIGSATYKGNIYGLNPASFMPLFYRKDVFKELNIDPPNTWSELIEVGKKIEENTDLAAISMYYSSAKGGQNKYCWAPIFWSNGGRVFNDDWKPVFNNEAGIEATKRYVELKDISAKGSLAFDEQDAMNSIAKNNSAMFYGWSWMYPVINSKMASEEVKGNVDIAAIPKWEGKQRAGGIFTMPWSVMEHSEHKRAAWEYIKWFHSVPVEKDILVSTWTDEAPEAQKTISASQIENYQDEKLNEISNGFYRTGLKSIRGAKVLPQIPEWP